MLTWAVATTTALSFPGNQQDRSIDPAVKPDGRPPDESLTISTMFPSPDVRVRIDLARIRDNLQRIRAQVSVPVIAVIKADAYGCGLSQVASAIADAVDSFCVFRPEEALAADLWNRTGKTALAIGPPKWTDPAEYIAHHVRPAVGCVADALRLRAARPVLCVDTGQQRFACRMDQAAAALRAGECDEAFTHGTTVDQAQRFAGVVSGHVRRAHAAGSSLLHEPAAWLDAVRPGLALYRGCARVSAKLVEVRRGHGPAGYSGFVAPFHGIIVGGYSNGLRFGPCLVNGRPSQILEVGMQSAFVEVGPDNRAGDEVVLLGDSLTEEQVARAWNTSPHEALTRLTGAGIREYVH